LKAIPIISTEAIEKALTETEQATKVKQKKGRKSKRKAISSEEEEENNSDDNSNDLESLQPEVFDCIEIVS
jgi:hypothetical protein